MKVVLVEANQRCCRVELLLLLMSQRMTCSTASIPAKGSAGPASADVNTRSPTSTARTLTRALARPACPHVFDHLCTHLTFSSAQSVDVPVFSIAAISTSLISIRLAFFFCLLHKFPLVPSSTANNFYIFQEMPFRKKWPHAQNL